MSNILFKCVSLLLSVVLIACVAAPKNDNVAKTPADKYADRQMLNTIGEYDSAKIVGDLIQKAQSFDSYARTFIVFGQKQKRMSFRFSKNGKPYYSFRSEYSMNGKPYVFFFNIDGFDYEYFPDQRTAYRSPSSSRWNESNYDQAKNWHFDYARSKVIGEDTVNGKECYVIQEKDVQTCVEKNTGLELYLNNLKGTMYYDDQETNLSDELFSLPPFIGIVDKKVPAEQEKR